MTDDNPEEERGMLENPYAEGTPLLWALGDTPKIRIIAALLSERERDIPLSDIAQLAGLSRSAVNNHLVDLIVLDFVKKTREIANSPFYQINMNSRGVQILADLEEWLLREWIGRAISQNFG